MAVHIESEEQIELGINNANFTASSNSSLSSSLGSPSTSSEAVGHPAGQNLAPQEWVDSEDEAGDLEPDWSSNVSIDVLQTLSDAEKKRQEIINEIYQTERNHVRTLRLLEGIFMRPLQESSLLSPDHLNLLFPSSLIVLKELHSSFEQNMKQRRIEHGSLIGNVGDLLLGMFDGNSGDELREHAAQFCARQQIALEALKEKRRKDENLHRLLTKAELHKACRRLQLKDLLPTALQRLTKYPLLFENLYKITTRVAPDNRDEAIAIQRALDSSRRILDHVNHAVRIAEDTHKLATIQKRLDKSSYDKEANNEFKNLDLTQHKLIYDGPLIMKKNPSVQLHGLLLETMMVLLIKQDDKYILKYQTSPGFGSGESRSIEGKFNPITKINLIFVRQSAVEKNTFFLINTNVSQMLELTAPSSSECKAWFKHISEAAEAYKLRTKGNHDHAPIVDDPATVTLSTSSNRESLDHNAEHDLRSTDNNEQQNQRDSRKHIDGTDESNESNNNDNFNKNDENYSNIDGINNDNNTLQCDDNDKKQIICNDGGSGTKNRTRTLTQQSSLVAPNEVQISISPAHKAEPVLTQAERLRRLDESIRQTLAEKQKIVCDIFKVPNEHFEAIADIAGQPEAPKEPSDIILAAFAQVQSLTETLNDHIKCPRPYEINSMSLLCDNCYSKGNNLTMKSIDADVKRSLNAQNNVPMATMSPDNDDDDDAKNAFDAIDYVPDDDGYCQIDELRLPAIVKSTTTTPSKNADKKQLKHEDSENADISKCENNEIVENADDDSKMDTLTSDESEQKTTKINNNTINDNNTNNSHNDNNNNEDNNNNSNNNNTDNNVDKTNDNVDDDDDNDNNVNTCNTNNNSATELNACGADHSKYAQKLPVVPCHLISAYVSALNLQISQLLPKLSERDIEREKLRKENQHLKNLVDSMRERMQVSSKSETSENGMPSQDSSS